MVSSKIFREQSFDDRNPANQDQDNAEARVLGSKFILTKRLRNLRVNSEPPEAGN